MARFFKTPWEKEWKKLEGAEKGFLKSCRDESLGFIEKKAEKHVPPKLQSTLNEAFYRAFQLVFTKGGGLIERTYNKEKRNLDFQIFSYAEELKKDRKTLSSFRKRAGGIRRANLAASALEGVGLGLLGIGLPDIPLFTGVLLKSVYEIAVNYGFSYEEIRERIFLLKVIEAAVSGRGDCERINKELNGWAETEADFSETLEEQLKRTAEALSKSLLYMKFIQGFAVLGVVGGISDVRCLHRVTAYANLKYQRRFLLKRRRERDR